MRCAVPPPLQSRGQLRVWLEYVAATAIDMLDALDKADEDREDDEREIYCEDEVAA